MDEDLKRIYFSDTIEVSATEAVRKFAEIRKSASRHPVHIHTGKSSGQTMLSDEMFATLSAVDRNGSDSGIDYRAKFELVVDSIDTHVCILNHKMQIRRLNLALRRATGVDELPVNFPVRKLLKDFPNGAIVLDRAEEVLVSGKAQRFEIDSILVEGQVREMRIFPWANGVMILSDDISDRYEIRRQKNRTKYMGMAVDHFGDIGRGVMDGQGLIVEASKPLAKMAGVARPDDLTGNRFLSLFSPQSRSRIEPLMFNLSKSTKIDAELIVGGTDKVPCDLVLSGFWDHGEGRSHGFVVRRI